MARRSPLAWVRSPVLFAGGLLVAVSPILPWLYWPGIDGRYPSGMTSTFGAPGFAYYLMLVGCIAAVIALVAFVTGKEPGLWVGLVLGFLALILIGWSVSQVAVAIQVSHNEDSLLRDMEADPTGLIVGRVGTILLVASSNLRLIWARHRRALIGFGLVGVGAVLIVIGVATAMPTCRWNYDVGICDQPGWAGAPWVLAVGVGALALGIGLRPFSWTAYLPDPVLRGETTSESMLRGTGAVLLLTGVPVFALQVWLADVRDFRTGFIGLDFAVIALPQLLAGSWSLLGPSSPPARRYAPGIIVGLVVALWNIVGQGGDTLIQSTFALQISLALVAALLLAAGWRLAIVPAPAPADWA
jgi:hypothetical protein